MGNSIVTAEEVRNRIYVIRGKRIILDTDLAELYEVETRVLNQAVTRNIERFPDDFMFQLTKQEFANLKSQIVISSWGGVRKMPRAFTEHGILMLSSVLKSERAIQVNIEIMRTFTQVREMISEYGELKEKIEQMEKKYDHQFKIVFDAIRQLLDPPEGNKRKIGFKA